jgi:hypothetical protein
MDHFPDIAQMVADMTPGQRYRIEFHDAGAVDLVFSHAGFFGPNQRGAIYGTQSGGSIVIEMRDIRSVELYTGCRGCGEA